MVHKKSEYTIQFHLLTNDVRKQIWQDNINFRESKRVLNQANHFWTDQFSEDQCQCEDEVKEDLGALPPNRVKHNMLLAQYGSQYPVPVLANTPLTSASRKHVIEALNNTLQRPQYQLQAHEPHLNSKNKIPDDRNICDPQSNYQDPANSTISQQPIIEMPKSTLEDPNLKDPNLKDGNLRTFKPPESYCERNKKLARNNTALDLPIFSGGKPKPLPGTEVTSLKHMPATSRSSTDKGLHSSRSVVTRTNLKSYYEEKKSPFAMFGWNDSQKTIGDKKTYNVYAPEKEVYEVALKARQRRRHEIEEFLAPESEVRQQKILDSADKCAKIDVDHGITWMTEYQHQFSRAQKGPLKPVQPSSNSPRRSVRNPASWRYS